MLRDEWCPGRSWDVRESRWPPGSQSFQSVHLWCSDGGCLQILHVKIRRSLPVHVLLARSVEFVGWCPQIPGLQPLQAPYCLPSQAFHPPFHRIQVPVASGQDPEVRFSFYRTSDRKSTRLNSSHVAISYAV